MRNVCFIQGSIGFVFYGENGQILLGPLKKGHLPEFIINCSLILRSFALFSLTNYYKVNQLSLILHQEFLLKYGI